MQILEGYAEFERFAYVVRDYKSAAKATSLLSSVASLATKELWDIARAPVKRLT